VGRFRRLTDAHFKKLENHELALALFLVYYDFCRVHSTIETTPEVRLGLTADVWGVAELLAAARRSA
jgi:hypothetical protein